jgi:hypothetical protein
MTVTTGTHQSARLWARAEGVNAGPRPALAAAGVGFASFFVTELMHSVLVPNIGRRWERLFAESISATVVGLLTLALLRAVSRHRAVALLRWQVISEMNEHVRNALAEISVALKSVENETCAQKITENVDYIDWALKEILLRPLPLLEPKHSARPRTGRRGE